MMKTSFEFDEPSDFAEFLKDRNAGRSQERCANPVFYHPRADSSAPEGRISFEYLMPNIDLLITVDVGNETAAAKLTEELKTLGLMVFKGDVTFIY